MAVSLTQEQLMTLARVARTPEGQSFLALLKTWQADVDKQLRTASGEELLRRQGDAQRLDELVGYLAGAAEARLNTLSQSRRPIPLRSSVEY